MVRVICPVMDARRNQVYTGLYRYLREFQVLKGQRIMAVEDLAREPAIRWTSPSPARIRRLQ